MSHVSLIDDDFRWVSEKIARVAAATNWPAWRCVKMHVRVLMSLR